MRQDGGEEGWTSPDFLSSTPPPYSPIDIGIPIEIDGLTYFSDDTGHNQSNMPDYLRVYCFDGVSPQSGFENAITVMESLGWQNESSEAISRADLLKADLRISGIRSLELTNDFSSGVPMSRSTYVMWKASDPSYLQIWYFPSNEVDKAQIDQVRELYAIAEDPSLSFEQKENKAKVCQRNWGEEVFATVVRLLPIYNTETKKFESFDSAMRDLAGSSSSDSGSPMEEDPVGAAVRIIIDPSWDTVKEMMGLP